MVLLSTSTLHHLCSLSRSASRFRIPNTTRSISAHQSRPPPSFAPPPARRRFEYTLPAPTPAANGATPRPNPKPDHTRAALARRPTNRDIPFEYVYVVDPQTNKLSPTKQSLKELLETRERRVIELVASSPEPVVRVTTRSEVEARYREMKRALKKGAKVSEESKEVQLLWGVAKADLEHKLRKATRDLEKGYRVVVVVTMKNRRRPSNRQELVVFANEISEALCRVGKEWKERGFTERSMILSFRKLEAELDDSS